MVTDEKQKASSAGPGLYDVTLPDGDVLVGVTKWQLAALSAAYGGMDLLVGQENQE